MLEQEELVTLVDEYDEVLGALPRSQFYRSRHVHRGAHLLLLDGDRVLLQIRAATKKVYPNRFETTVGGTVVYNDACDDTIHRESIEEIGMDFDMEFLGKFFNEDEIDRAWSYSYIVYEYFSIPLPLQQHMIDVASVAMMICEHWQGIMIDTKSIITAALVHDLGNIVKIDFSGHAEYYQQNLTYRKTIKQDIIDSYGNDCHMVTKQMIEELGDFGKISMLVDDMGSHDFEAVHSLELDILNYADMRVAYDGVVTLEARLADVYARYKTTRRRAQEPVWTNYQSYYRTIEEDIFHNSSISSLDISQESTRVYAEQLQDFELENVHTKLTK